MAQVIELDAGSRPVVLARLSEQARSARNLSNADRLLLLAWTAYNEFERSRELECRASAA